MGGLVAAQLERKFVALRGFGVVDVLDGDRADDVLHTVFGTLVHDRGGWRQADGHIIVPESAAGLIRLGGVLEFSNEGGGAVDGQVQVAQSVWRVNAANVIAGNSEHTANGPVNRRTQLVMPTAFVEVAAGDEISCSLIANGFGTAPQLSFRGAWAVIEFIGGQ